MEIFDKKKAEEIVGVNERPRVCCIDISNDVISELKGSKFKIYSGTLGSKIRVPNNARRDKHQLRLNYNFPPNLHEYDIIILDLNNSQTIKYKQEEHIRNSHTGMNAVSLLSSYPETIFDPRPLSSSILNKKISQIGKRPNIVIVFTTSLYSVEYQKIIITESHTERLGTETHSIYSFASNVLLSKAKCGEEIIVCNIREDLKNLLELYIKKTVYNQTFHHPTILKDNKNVPDPNYLPLLKNSSDDIVSICESKNNSLTFYFPQIESKGKFLNTLLSQIAPDMFPEVFPFSTTFNWKHKKEYWLPNHRKLLDEKKKIEDKYKKKLKLKDNEISKNTEHYSFLHDIITETGENLTDSLIQYLKWLGFEKVIKVDEENMDSKMLEEDIQVEIENGLLIIECKGIGGTSTDSDCSQISKIKHRRCKERNKFDVYALYIVNHQRYLPPLSRQNPPFTENQKQDAINDERGLLSTWQLFNLYYDIENKIIDKKSARNDLLKYGFIEFKPKGLVYIDEPKEIFKNGKVCIVNISNIDLSIGDEILVENNGKIQRSMIKEIQLNDKPVSNVTYGEIGLKLNIAIKKKSILWKKSSTADNKIEDLSA